MKKVNAVLLICGSFLIGLSSCAVTSQQGNDSTRLSTASEGTAQVYFVDSSIVYKDYGNMGNGFFKYEISGDVGNKGTIKTNIIYLEVSYYDINEKKIAQASEVKGTLEPGSFWTFDIIEICDQRIYSYKLTDLTCA